MHQSGHSRAHSMQTVQFSSLRAMTPRARVGGASFSWGYCTVTAPSSMVLNVMPRPLMSPLPGMSGMRLEHHLEHASRHDVDQRDGDEELPGQGLQLVLPEPGEREAHPEDQEGDDHDLGAEHDG